MSASETNAMKHLRVTASHKNLRTIVWMKSSDDRASERPKYAARPDENFTKATELQQVVTRKHYLINERCLDEVS